MSRAVAVAGGFLFFLASLAQAQFLQMPQYGNGTDAASFVQTDVNHDGKTDILGIVKNTDAVPTSIAVLLGNGSGGFGAPITTAISGVDNPINAAVGDFNGDGFPDVALFGSDHTTGQNAIAVMLGNGNGTFQAGKETLIGGVATAIAGVCYAPTADFNGDDKLDVAYLASSSGAISVNVLLGEGNGTFSTPPSSISVNSAATCLVAGDFNNDKKIDVVASSNGAVFTLLGKGNGTFETPITAGTTGGIMIAAEMNADDNLDLVLELRAPSSIGVLLGDGTGHFPTKNVYSAVSNLTYEGFAVEDINGDGHPDVAVLAVNFNNGGVIKTLLNNGAGALTAGKSYDADGATSDLGLLAADLTTGGHIDLAFGNDAGGFTVLAGNGNGTFKGNFASPAPGSGIEVGQFDTKAPPDLLLETPGTLAITLLGNGDGSFSGGVHSAGCGSPSLTIGDFNHDGISDIAGVSSVGDVPVIAVCLGKGNGTFTPFGNFDQGVSHSTVNQGLFSGNGKIDIVASDEHGFSVLLGDGDGSFANGIPTSVDGNNPSIQVGAFFTNTNTKIDVVALTSAGVAVFPGNGNGTFGAPVVSAGTPTSGQITVTDLNGDGKRDLIITSAGHVVVMLGNGNGTFTTTTYKLPSNAMTRAVVADFNGDGILDVAVGFVDGIDVFFGTGGGALNTTPTLFRTGGPVESLATADFNLDTKPDLAALMVDGNVVTLLNQK